MQTRPSDHLDLQFVLHKNIGIVEDVCAFACACSVGTVGAPVVREEADFGLPSRKDTLQAGLFRGVAHVLHHPLQQLRGRHGGGGNIQ